MGKKVYVAAVVNEVTVDENGVPVNKYYLDEVVDAEGFRFNIVKEDSDTTKADHRTRSADNGGSESSSAKTVPQTATAVNSEEKGNASVSVVADIDVGDTENYGEIDSSIRVPGRVEKREATQIAVTEGYPSLLNDEGEAVTAIPGWTWVRANDRGNYGVVVGKDGNM